MIEEKSQFKRSETMEVKDFGKNLIRYFITVEKLFWELLIVGGKSVRKCKPFYHILS